MLTIDIKWTERSHERKMNFESVCSGGGTPAMKEAMELLSPHEWECFQITILQCTNIHAYCIQTSHLSSAHLVTRLINCRTDTAAVLIE